MKMPKLAEVSAPRSMVKGLSVNKFKSWIKRTGLQYEVGLRGECDRCPIANFMFATTDRMWFVCSDRIVDSRTLRSFHIPKWAIEFIDIIDERPEFGMRVYGGEALGAMEELKKCRTKLED